jgi:hypothetical protein
MAAVCFAQGTPFGFLQNKYALVDVTDRGLGFILLWMALFHAPRFSYPNSQTSGGTDLSDIGAVPMVWWNAVHLWIGYASCQEVRPWEQVECAYISLTFPFLVFEVDVNRCPFSRLMSIALEFYGCRNNCPSARCFPGSNLGSPP